MLVEYLTRAGWAPGHRSIDLKDPEKYVVRCRLPARVTDEDRVYTTPGVCPACEAMHDPPYDGGCLI